MTPEERAAARCYVAMRGDDKAAAAMVIDGTPKKELAKFLRDCAGEDIRTVSVAEARVLLGNYFAAKKEAANG